MLIGLALTVTWPFVPVTVTGHWAAAGVEEVLAALDAEPEPPQPVRARGTARSSAESAVQRGMGRDTGSLQKRRKTSPRSHSAPCATLTARVGDMTQGRRSGSGFPTGRPGDPHSCGTA